MKRVFFHVQHLLGIGHLKRAVTVCRALADAGFDVTLASGGMPVRDLQVPGKLVQLPSMSASDVTFKTMLDGRGQPITEDWKAKRAAKLLEAWRQAKADVLIVELFPFGRRQLRFELLPLLEAARGALVVCSVRDLLQSRPAREAEAVALLERYFDRVLVHGDPRIAPFEASFAAARRIAGRLAYTGYVVEAASSGSDPELGKGEVLVSAGGGAVGRRLIETAIAARPLTRLRDRTWRLIAGMNASYLESIPPRKGIVLETFRNDFTMLLRNCELSVSQAGYNTVMETLQARARAVVVPFSQGSETEQGMRARMMAERGLLTLVEEKDLSRESLAAAIDAAAARPRPARVEVDMNGARASAALLRQWTA
ncbi:MAG: glycosyltransferase family protein [Betaproteobacteria bacterium]